MSGQDEGGEKIHDPTPRRLEEARRKGEVPRSAELTTAAAWGALAIVALTAGPGLVAGLGTAGVQLLGGAGDWASLLAGGARPVVGQLMVAIVPALTPLFIIPALAALAALAAQRALVVAPQKLKPRLSRVSPVAGARNKFGRNGLFEFAKSLVKLGVISGILWAFLLAQLPRIAATLHLSPEAVGSAAAGLATTFLGLVAAVMFLIGGVDFLWQQAEHRRKHRMSHQELRDEFKQSEGDPNLKAERRNRAQQIASNRMMADVPQADVVIVNPTHFAVALRWDKARGTAPICIAKGVDEVARRIRERAAEAGVPLRHDPPTARALHAALDIGDEVLPEHYREVAAAIRFAEAMRKRARRRSR